MKDLRLARVAALLVLSMLGLAIEASRSSADESTGELYGTVDAVDPLVGFDWAPAVDDPDVDAARANGATVSDVPCTIGDRPNAPAPEIFRRPIRTTGHLVTTPSGNVSFVCHAAVDARFIRPPLPDQAIVVDRAACFLPGGRRTNDTHLVVTPSFNVHLVCQFKP
jgi:hypothetical protein